MLPRLISLCSILLIASTTLAATTEPAADARAKVLKDHVQQFQLRITYTLPMNMDKTPTYVSGQFAVDENALSHLALPVNTEMVHITAEEAQKIIDQLVASGLLEECEEAKGDVPGSAGDPGEYRLEVMSSWDSQWTVYRLHLGLDLGTIRALNSISDGFQGQAAKALATVIDRLKVDQPRWEKEGRVFAQNGLAVLMKPAKAEFSDHDQLTFDLTLVNESTAPFVLVTPLDSPMDWTLEAQGAKPEMRYRVIPPEALKRPIPEPLTLKPWQPQKFTFSLGGCHYLRTGGELRRNVPAASLPAGTYTLVGALTEGSNAVAEGPTKWEGTVRIVVPFTVVQSR